MKGTECMASDKTIRVIDKMGRVVIPYDLRKETGLEIGDEISFAVSGKSIVITPITNHCAFCNSKNDLIPYIGKYICKHCAKEIKML